MEEKKSRKKYIAGNTEVQSGTKSPGCMTVKKEPFVKHITAHTVPLSTPLHTEGNEEEVAVHREPTSVREGKLISS